MPPDRRHRVIRPENCFFGVGIPMSEVEFKQHHRDRTPRFAKKYRGTTGRTRYKADVIRPFSKCAAKMRRLGVQVRTRLTIDQLWQQFFDGDTHAIVLFSHWGKNEHGEDAVEFSPGFVPVTRIVNGIPDEVTKIIDLCVCHPDGLVAEILARRPRITVRFNPGKSSALCQAESQATSQGLTPDFWLYFYSTLFRYIRSGRFTYVEAHKNLILRALGMVRARPAGAPDPAAGGICRDQEH